jgi:hypothetical protein
VGAVGKTESVSVVEKSEMRNKRGRSRRAAAFRN